MATRKQILEQMGKEKEIGQMFIKRHAPHEYWPCEENAMILAEWISKSRQLYGEKIVEQAFQALRSEGVNFLRQRPQQAVDDESLPGHDTLPSEITQKLRTKKDLRDLDVQLLKRWLNDSRYRSAVEARIKAIGERGI